MALPAIVEACKLEMKVSKYLARSHKACRMAIQLFKLGHDMAYGDERHDMMTAAL